MYIFLGGLVNHLLRGLNPFHLIRRLVNHFSWKSTLVKGSQILLEGQLRSNSIYFISFMDYPTILGMNPPP